MHITKFLGLLIGMENKRILHLAILTISKDDRKKLDQHEIAFLSTMAFAVDEISVFQKLYVQSLALQPKDEDLLLLHVVQHNTIARVLAAKLFEAVGLFEKYQKFVNRRADSAEKVELTKYSARLDDLKSMPGYSLAKVLRDHATNHYIPQETEKNIEYVSGRAKYIAVLDEMQGNSYYPFGEEVVFMGRIGIYFQEIHGRDYTIEDINSWSDWMVATSKWLTKMFSAHMLWLHKTRFPDWELVQK